MRYIVVLGGFRILVNRVVPCLFLSVEVLACYRVRYPGILSRFSKVVGSGPKGCLTGEMSHRNFRQLFHHSGGIVQMNVVTGTSLAFCAAW